MKFYYSTIENTYMRAIHYSSGVIVEQKKK
jgi:hypothetical protein